jgi:YD repeat-containing protein
MAEYDEAGDLTCRAPFSATTCPQTGTQTGAILSYDNVGQLSGWQNAPTSPTTTASYLYDGEGQRVQQVVTSGSTTTTTTYVGSLEELATTGSTTTTTAYYGGIATSALIPQFPGAHIPHFGKRICIVS